MSSLASAGTSNSPKKILVPKKRSSTVGSLDNVGKDLNLNLPVLDEKDLMDDLDNDVVTFYVQQVLRLGRKTHATLEVDMDKSVVNVFKARSDKERRSGDESVKVFPCSAFTKFEY